MYLTPFSMTIKVKVTVTSIAVAVVVVLATVMITATTSGLTELVFAQGPSKIVINLTGSEEVPPVQTEAKVEFVCSILFNWLSLYCFKSCTNLMQFLVINWLSLSISNVNASRK